MNRLYYLFFLILILTSCSNVNFVVKQHNFYVQNLKGSGKQLYEAQEMTYDGDRFTDCKFDKKTNRLNTLVPTQNYALNPIDTFHFDCSIYISFEYLQKMKNFVENSNKNQLKKMKALSQQEYDSICLNFISIDKVNTFIKK